MNLSAGVVHYIVLTQPWATLMAIGTKQVETRSWSTTFRGPLGIHAAASFPKECRALCYRPPFARALAQAGYNAPDDLPLGQVLAVTEVYDCQPTQDIRELLTWEERQFGDYTAGRYGWLTRGVRRLREPFPLRGLQRIQKLPSPIAESELLPHG